MFLAASSLIQLDSQNLVMSALLMVTTVDAWIRSMSVLSIMLGSVWLESGLIGVGRIRLV
jgi:hypothetical protein